MIHDAHRGDDRPLRWAVALSLVIHLALAVILPAPARPLPGQPLPIHAEITYEMLPAMPNMASWFRTPLVSSAAAASEIPGAAVLTPASEAVSVAPELIPVMSNPNPPALVAVPDAPAASEPAHETPADRTSDAVSPPLVVAHVAPAMVPSSLKDAGGDGFPTVAPDRASRSGVGYAPTGGSAEGSGASGPRTGSPVAGTSLSGTPGPGSGSGTGSGSGSGSGAVAGSSLRGYLARVRDWLAPRVQERFAADRDGRSLDAELSVVEIRLRVPRSGRAEILDVSAPSPVLERIVHDVIRNSVMPLPPPELDAPVSVRMRVRFRLT